MAKKRPVAEDPQTVAMIENAIVEARANSSLMWLADRAADFPDPDDDLEYGGPDELPSQFTERQRDLIAAAILYSCDLTTDGMAFDEDNLSWHLANGRRFDFGDTGVLSQLPEQFWPRIDLPFVTRFGTALTVVSDRFKGDWSAPRNVAEELAIRILLSGAVDQLSIWEVDMPGYWVSNIQEVLFEDLDHESLYDAKPPSAKVAKAMGFAAMGFGDLFDAFRDSEPVDY